MSELAIILVVVGTVGGILGAIAGNLGARSFMRAMRCGEPHPTEAGITCTRFLHPDDEVGHVRWGEPKNGWKYIYWPRNDTTLDATISYYQQHDERPVSGAGMGERE